MKELRVYECLIEYEKTGCCGDTDKKDIWVLARSVKIAIAKASVYRETGTVKKTLEVKGVKFVGIIDQA